MLFFFVRIISVIILKTFYTESQGRVDMSKFVYNEKPAVSECRTMKMLEKIYFRRLCTANTICNYLLQLKNQNTKTQTQLWVGQKAV